MSLRLGTTVIAGSVDLNGIKQEIYDGIYPINGDPVIGFNHPGVPAGVTATWEDVSSLYEGRYFKVSSTEDAGTSQNAMIPSHYHLYISDGNWNLARGGSGSTVGVAQADGGAIYGDLMRTGDTIATIIPNTEVGNELRPLTTTVKVWKRTA